MAEENFRLENRQEVERFESLVDAYVKERAQFPLKHLSLVVAYDYCQLRADGGKLFAAVLDVFINFLLLYCDTNAVGSTWNRYFAKGRLQGGSVLDSEAKFFGKMDVHRYNSSFVLRYRALWDKIMGLLILMYAPEKYDEFFSSRSRKRIFFKISKGSKILAEETAEYLKGMLERFDNEFRTPEAHGTGALRKWSFTMEPMNENPSIKLIGHWNILIEIMALLGKSFQSRPVN